MNETDYLTAEQIQEQETPVWAQVKAPDGCRPFLGRKGLPEPFHSKQTPLGPKVLGVERWQANHFIVHRPETAGVLYGSYTPTTVDYRPGTLPAFEALAAEYTSGLIGNEEIAAAFVTRVLPERLPHATVPPVGAYCRTDRGLHDEALLATGSAYCSGQALAFIRLCQVRGIAARLVFLFYSDRQTGHTTAEFWTGSKWAMVDVSWYTLFPGPDGKLMSAADCHGDAAQRLCLAVAYQTRMRQIVAMSDEALCGRAFPSDTPDRAAAVRAKAAELRDYVRVRMPLDHLADHLWEFGILNYPLPR